MLHIDDNTEFRSIVGVMDAIDATRRELVVGSKAEKVPAFDITFAVN